MNGERTQHGLRCGSTRRTRMHHTPTVRLRVTARAVVAAAAAGRSVSAANGRRMKMNEMYAAVTAVRWRAPAKADARRKALPHYTTLHNCALDACARACVRTRPCIFMRVYNTGVQLSGGGAFRVGLGEGAGGGGVQRPALRA